MISLSVANASFGMAAGNVNWFRVSLSCSLYVDLRRKIGLPLPTFFGRRADDEIVDFTLSINVSRSRTLNASRNGLDGCIPAVIGRDEERVVYAHHLDLFLSCGAGGAERLPTLRSSCTGQDRRHQRQIVGTPLHGYTPEIFVMYLIVAAVSWG